MKFKRNWFSCSVLCKYSGFKFVSQILKSKLLVSNFYIFFWSKYCNAFSKLGNSNYFWGQLYLFYLVAKPKTERQIAFALLVFLPSRTRYLVFDLSVFGLIDSASQCCIFHMASTVKIRMSNYVHSQNPTLCIVKKSNTNKQRMVFWFVYLWNWNLVI